MRHTTSLKAITICAMLASVTACVDPDQRSDTSQSALILPPMMNTRPATFKCGEIGVVVVRPVGEDGTAITASSLTAGSIRV